MSVQIERATLPCGVCGAQVSELRRGRCWGCYSRWVEARPVGRGASCVICRERRRSELRMLEVHGRSHTFCHSCAGHLARLDKVPTSIITLRGLLTRERRERDRRENLSDRRIFPRERRVGERRGAPRDVRPEAAAGDHLADLADVIIELEAADIEPVEQTIVKSTGRDG